MPLIPLFLLKFFKRSDPSYKPKYIPDDDFDWEEDVWDQLDKTFNGPAEKQYLMPGTKMIWHTEAYIREHGLEDEYGWEKK